MSEKILTIGKRELDADECSILAFKIFEQSFDLDKTLRTWRLMLDDDGYPQSDLIFLLLHFHEHMLAEEDKPEMELVMKVLKAKLKG